MITYIALGYSIPKITEPLNELLNLSRIELISSLSTRPRLVWPSVPHFRSRSYIKYRLSE
ncbi:hypothetical protein J6590_009099 [Homalodisca vitripennis]|nr:hypothetical protein J6590_009099 [Homalodisca vitripennis]